MEESTSWVRAQRREGVLELTLSRPERGNAMAGPMVEELRRAIDGASSDDVTRVVLLRAEGKDFCTGIDLAEATGRTSGSDERPSKPRTGATQRSLPQGAHGLIEAMDAAQVPIVARVQGWAAGFGCALALSADFVVVTPETRFWVPFLARGFTPDSGTTWVLPRLIGLARARQMILRAQPIDGAIAAEWGMVATCVDAADLDGEVGGLVEELGRSATVSVGLARRLLGRNLTVSLHEALENEATTVELATRSDDFKEGMRAFMDKRPPEFTGR